MIGEQKPEPAGQYAARQVREAITRYVGLAPEHVTALVLWVLHTWTFGASVTTPYLAIVSAEKQSGKTRLLEVLELLVREPLMASGASEAALFRVIEAKCPTLLHDECDALFASDSKRTEPIRGLLNGGNRSSGKILRSVRPDFDVKEFSTFSPKALAGIDNGQWPDTILDRSIVVRMRRKAPRDQVVPFRFRDALRGTEGVREACQVWAEQTFDELATREPEMPRSLSDRACDAWEPLLAIADSLSLPWGIEARNAATLLYERETDRGESAGTTLLRDIEAVFREILSDRVTSSELVSRLRTMPEAPWSDFGNSGRSGLTQAVLARLLRPYEIKSRTIRLASHHSTGATARGYLASDFAKAWGMYLVADNTADDESM